MFLTSGTAYYSIPLPNITIMCKSKHMIQDPNIKFKLLSFSDITKIDILFASNMSMSDIYDEICNKCILGILYYEGEEIDFERSPAGVLEHLGEKILYHSRDLLKDIQKTFEIFSSNITLLDQIQAFVSRYTVTPIKEVRDLPLDQLIRDFSIIQAAFPNEIQPIVLEEEQVSRVGG